MCSGCHEVRPCDTMVFSFLFDFAALACLGLERKMASSCRMIMLCVQEMCVKITNVYEISLTSWPLFAAQQAWGSFSDIPFNSSNRWKIFCIRVLEKVIISYMMIRWMNNEGV
jgi:hypothetical protein